MTRFALLFDLDGTLIDSDPLHHAAYATLFAERGDELSLDQYHREIMGRPNADIMAQFWPDEPENHAAIAARKELMFRDSLAASVPPTQGIHALLDWAAASGAGVAVVTNAPRDNAETMLRAAGLAPRFDLLIIGEECARAKPDPLPYQLAMQALDVTPSRCVAFEDSASGLRAARGAGAHVFGLTTGLSPQRLRQAGAHDVIDDFTDPALLAHLDTLKARIG